MKNLLVLSVFGIILLSGCTAQQYPTSTTTSSQPSSSTSQVQTYQTSVPQQTSTTTVTNVKTFTVHESSFKIDPSSITVNKGDNVQITIISDDIGHDFCIEGYNICSATVSSGGSTKINFVADKSGTFAFYCNIDGHRSFGMQGQLTVQ